MYVLGVFNSKLVVMTCSLVELYTFDVVVKLQNHEL